MQNLSIEHTVVTINGHRFEGWGAGADSIQFPDQNLAETNVGADGQMVASSTGMRGGEIVLKLQPNSPSVAFMAGQILAIQRGGSVVWNGTVRNGQTGVTTRLERGVLKTAPLGQSVGNEPAPVREYTFEFESILTDMSGARVQSPPAAPNI